MIDARLAGLQHSLQLLLAVLAEEVRPERTADASLVAHGSSMRVCYRPSKIAQAGLDEEGGIADR